MFLSIFILQLSSCWVPEGAIWFVDIAIVILVSKILVITSGDINETGTDKFASLSILCTSVTIVKETILRIEPLFK